MEEKDGSKNLYFPNGLLNEATVVILPYLNIDWAYHSHKYADNTFILKHDLDNDLLGNDKNTILWYRYVTTATGGS